MFAPQSVDTRDQSSRRFGRIETERPTRDPTDTTDGSPTYSFGTLIRSAASAIHSRNGSGNRSAGIEGTGSETGGSFPGSGHESTGPSAFAMSSSGVMPPP